MADTISDRDLINRVLDGRYEPILKLGEGGFGRVYQARQTATGQLVALKVLQQQGAHSTDKLIARFRREMRLCAQLHHPHIVRLIDSGQSDEGLLWLAFEYVPGDPLNEILLAHHSGFDFDEGLRLMVQVLDALGCAHARGVVHRDLKPHNIMVTRSGLRRNAMVLDFGVGTAVDFGGCASQTPLTASTDMVGTPAYAAPEQFLGGSITARTDLYSWALVTLEVLTGQRAVSAAGIAELLAWQASSEAVKIPDWLRGQPLGDVLGRVLTKDSERRTPSAEQLLLELEACRSSFSGHSPPHIRSKSGDAANSSPAVPPGEMLTTAATLVGSTASMRALGEWRHITVLCCTIEVAAQTDDLRTALDAVPECEALCSEFAATYHGYFGGQLGGKLAFFFGYPSAREDDAQRAIRCALAIRDAHQRQLEGQRSSSDVNAPRTQRPQIGLVVHSGMVVTRSLRDRSFGDVIGLPPMIAQAIESQAPEVIISDATRAIVRHKFRLSPAGRQPLPRLVADELELFQVEAECEASSDTPLAIEALIGREQELSVLGRGWQHACDGRGEAVLLSGEAGVGKSRLLRSLRESPSFHGHRWFECHCDPRNRNSPLHPLVDALELELFESGAGDQQRLAQLEALANILCLEDHAWRLLATLLSVPLDPALHPPLSLTPERQRALTISTLVALFLELSEQRPLTFAIEDLHWADPSTLEVLTELLATIESSRVFVVATARPQFNPPTDLNFGLKLRLAPFARNEAEALVHALMGPRPMADEVVEQIVARGDGVPLYIEELTQAVLSNKGLVSRSADFQLQVPDSLRNALMARLDRLGPARQIAHVASAFGREFAEAHLRAVLSELDEAEFDQQLMGLCDAGLVHRRRRRGQYLVTFKHALVRDVAHDTMLPEQRQQIHARVASTLERDFGTVVEQRPDLLAYHHRQAMQNGRAIDYGQRAAQKALQHSANQEAGAHAMAALEWLSDLSNDRERALAELNLNRTLSRVLMVTNGYADLDIEALVRRSEQLIDSLGAHEHIFPNLASLSIFYLIRGRVALASSYADRLVKLARGSGDRGQEVYALSHMAQCALFEARFDRVLDSSARTRELFDPAKDHTHVFEYGQDSLIISEMHRAICLVIKGQLAPAEDIIEGCQQRTEGLNIPHISFSFWFGLACIRMYAHDREGVVAVSEHVRALAARQGGSWFVALIEGLRAWAEGSLEVLQPFVSGMLDSDQTFTHGLWLTLLAELERDAGQLPQALERCTRALAHHDDGSTFFLPEIHRVTATIHARMGQFSHAQSSLEQAIETARSTGARLFELRAACELVRSNAERHRNDGDPRLTAAREQLAQVSKYFMEDDVREARLARKLLRPPVSSTG